MCKCVVCSESGSATIIGDTKWEQMEEGGIGAQKCGAGFEILSHLVKCVHTIRKDIHSKEIFQKEILDEIHNTVLLILGNIVLTLFQLDA